MPQELPNLDDLQLFVEICDALDAPESGPSEMSMNMVANTIERAPSAISTCLTRLESTYGKTLISGRTRLGRPKLEPFGKRFRDRCKEILQQCAALGSGEETTLVRIATTDTIRLRVLPGAVSAYMLWLRKDDQDTQVDVRVEAVDHPEIIQGLRDERYDFALAWDMPDERYRYSDIHFDDWLGEELSVDAVALMPEEKDEVRGHNFVEQKAMRERLHDLFVRTKRTKSVRLTSLCEALKGNKLVLVNTESGNLVRDSLLKAADPSKVLRVDNYEDVLTCIRCFIADLGIAPEWYRHRKNVLKRTIVDDANQPISRRIAILRKKGKDSKAAKDLRPRAMELLTTLMKFIEDHAVAVFGKTKEKTSNQDLDPPDPGQSVGPAQVLTWMEEKLPAIFETDRKRSQERR